MKLRLLGRKSLPWVLRTAFFVCAIAFSASLADAGVSNGITNIFKPLSTPAESVYEISLLVLAICAGIFLTVGGLLAYTLIRFRRRPGGESHRRCAPGAK